jgi:hypothetical protein
MQHICAATGPLHAAHLRGSCVDVLKVEIRVVAVGAVMALCSVLLFTMTAIPCFFPVCVGCQGLTLALFKHLAYTASLALLMQNTVYVPECPVRMPCADAR